MIYEDQYQKIGEVIGELVEHQAHEIANECVEAEHDSIMTAVQGLLTAEREYMKNYIKSIVSTQLLKLEDQHPTPIEKLNALLDPLPAGIKHTHIQCPECHRMIDIPYV